MLERSRSLERSWATTTNRLATGTLSAVDRMSIAFGNFFLRVQRQANIAALSLINFANLASRIASLDLTDVQGTLEGQIRGAEDLPTPNTPRGRRARQRPVIERSTGFAGSASAATELINFFDDLIEGADRARLVLGESFIPELE